jgi:two-component system sensor histidine kinase AlgZ
MPKTRSINQNIQHKPLPNFRNLGTVLRIVLMANGIALLGAVSQNTTFAELLNSLLQGSALLQPVLLASLLLLYALNPVLERVTEWQSALAVAAVVAATSLMIDTLGGELFSGAGEAGVFRYARHALLGSIVAWILMAYFRLRAQALSPAKQEARLQALQARIRPHFLFNTINAVLGVVRADPKRAETALEDMADLFRMAMSEPHELVGLNKEVQLARQYLALEQMRMGERLQVRWDTENMPGDALIPPLVLQPLLENAVYHGIEPKIEGGIIEVNIYREGKELHLQVSNPVSGSALPNPKSNKMALSNIRERLSLLFDLEADYRVERGVDFYNVHILIPYVQEATQ